MLLPPIVSRDGTHTTRSRSLESHREPAQRSHGRVLAPAHFAFREVPPRVALAGAPPLDATREIPKVDQAELSTRA
jgi:hypothetical protein